jgi:hypothetical protein
VLNLLTKFGIRGRLKTPCVDRVQNSLVAVSSRGSPAPARDFGACLVSFDGKALTVGEPIDAAPGVKLIRRC